MPILGTLLVFLYERLGALLGFFGAQALTALVIRRGLVIALIVGFVAAINACLSFLLGAANAIGSGGGVTGGFLMGLGMFIPSNAGAIMSCLGAVWLACFMYRLKLTGLRP